MRYSTARFFVVILTPSFIYWANIKLIRWGLVVVVVVTAARPYEWIFHPAVVVTLDIYSFLTRFNDGNRPHYYAAYKVQITRYFGRWVCTTSRMVDLKTFNGPYKRPMRIHILHTHTHTASIRIMQRHSLRCITSDLFVAISVNYYNANTEHSTTHVVITCVWSHNKLGATYCTSVKKIPIRICWNAQVTSIEFRFQIRK